MLRNHNRLHSPEDSTKVDALFLGISERFEEALGLASKNPSFTYITIDILRDETQVAVFNLVESEDSYRRNEGEVMEVRVPIDTTAVNSSPLLLLTGLNPDRFIIFSHYDGSRKSPREYKITDRVEDLNDTSRYGKDSIDQYLRKVTGSKAYKIVPLRSRGQIDIPDEAITDCET